MRCIQALSIVLLLIIYCSSWVEGEEIACPAGWVSTNGKFPNCQACPKGTYQNKPSRKVCKPCPSNTTTDELAAVSKKQCIPVNDSDEGTPCEAGSYSSTGYSPCEPCSIGYYSVNTTTCKKCPSRRTTVSVGATHKRNCTKPKNIVLCPQGSISSSGHQPCSKCPIGYHQPYQGERVCAKCPEGLSNKAEGAIDCINVTETLETTFNHTCATTKYKKLKGVKLSKLNKVQGYFSSTNYPEDYTPGTMQQWKIHCFHGEYVGVIISHMDLSEGDYLQVNDDQCSGRIAHPTSRIIRKRSTGVTFSGQSGNSTGFQCAFLCIEEYKRAWAESILYNDKIMEVIKPVNSTDTIAVQKAIELILEYPKVILTGFNDPYQRKILQINFGNIQ